MLAWPVISELKHKGLENCSCRRLRYRIGTEPVCTNPLMDYWPNCTEGVPDRSQFLISPSIYCTLWAEPPGTTVPSEDFSLQCKKWLTLCPLSVSSPCKVSHSEGQGKACWVVVFAAWVTFIVSSSHLGLCSFTVSQQEFRPTLSFCLTDH